MGDDSLVLRLMLTAGLTVATVGAVAAVLLYALFRRSREPLLASRNHPRPIWNGFAVLGAVAVVIVFSLASSSLQNALSSAGFFRAIYGPDFPTETATKQTSPNKDDLQAQRAKAATTIRYLWTTTIAFPFQLLLLFYLPRWMKVTNPFHKRGWPMAAIAGYLTWLIVTPAAFCVFVLASMAHMKLTGLEPEKHPLTALGDMAGDLEKTFFVLQTVLIAPVVEEWLFRGVLLPWLAQKRPAQPQTDYTIPPTYRPLAILIGAVVIAVAFTLGTDYSARPDEVRRTFTTDTASVVASYVIPAGFFLALIPFDFVLPRLHRLRKRLRIRSTQQLRAIWACAAMFAAVHAHVWPSPVPLLVLSLGLGYLYLRTRSLVGPIIVHGMFNAVSAMYLLLGGPR